MKKTFAACLQKHTHKKNKKSKKNKLNRKNNKNSRDKKSNTQILFPKDD